MRRFAILGALVVLSGVGMWWGAYKSPIRPLRVDLEDQRFLVKQSALSKQIVLPLSKKPGQDIPESPSVVADDRSAPGPDPLDHLIANLAEDFSQDSRKVQEAALSLQSSDVNQDEQFIIVEALGRCSTNGCRNLLAATVAHGDRQNQDLDPHSAAGAHQIFQRVLALSSIEKLAQTSEGESILKEIDLEDSSLRSRIQVVLAAKASGVPIETFDREIFKKQD